MTREEYLFKQYGNILDWYKQAEDKSKFLVSINAVAIGAVNALVFVGADKAAAVRGLFPAVLWALLAAAGAALVASYLFVLNASRARHDNTEEPLKPEEKLWFFGHIGGLTAEEHRARMELFDENGVALTATMIAQNRILSRNVDHKFDALNRAATLTVLAFILLFAMGIVYALAVAGIATPAPH